MRIFLLTLLLPLALLGADPVPQTFDELWADCDPRAEPLDVEMLHGWEEDGVTLRVLRYTVGTFKGKPSRMAALFGYPTGAKKLPGLVQIHGGGQYADSKAVLTNAKRGYTTISIAWAGRISAPDYRVSPAEVQLFWDGATDHPSYKVTTDWGAVEAYHAPSRYKENQFPNLQKPSDWTIDPVPSPRNNSWYLCTLAARRALTFLEQQPQVDPAKLGVYGHSMGGKLTVLTAASDDRVKAAAPSCGGISDRYNKDPLFRATLGDDAYLKNLSCPVFFLSPANDFHGRINDLQTALTEIKATDWRITSAPHHNHQDTAPHEVATQLWFDEHLKGTFCCPGTPGAELDLGTKDGTPVFTVRPDTSRPVLSVEILFTEQGEPGLPDKATFNPKTRFWHHAAATEKDGIWTASIELSGTSNHLWVYANVTYALDEPITGAGYYYRVYTAETFSLASEMAMVTPAQLQAAGIRASRPPSLVIEAFEDGWEKDWFSYRPEQWPRSTHKISDTRFRAPEGGASLCFEVYAEEPNKLVVGLDTYAAEIDLYQSGAWQEIELILPDFSSAAGKAPTSWEGLETLSLGHEVTLRERSPERKLKLGGPWKGSPPEFRNLRWKP